MSEGCSSLFPSCRHIMSPLSRTLLFLLSLQPRRKLMLSRKQFHSSEVALGRRPRLARVLAASSAASAILLFGVALAMPATAEGRLFVSNYSDDTVTVFPRDVDGDVEP